MSSGLLSKEVDVSTFTKFGSISSLFLILIVFYRFSIIVRLFLDVLFLFLNLFIFLHHLVELLILKNVNVMYGNDVCEIHLYFIYIYHIIRLQGLK